MSRAGARGRESRPAPAPSGVLRRKWLAAAAGTILATISFWLIVAAATDEAAGARPVLVGAGLVVLGLAFMGLVAISGTPRPLRATGLAMAACLGSFLVVALAGFLAEAFITFSGVAAIALGIGGSVALATNGAPVAAPRMWAVVAVTILTWGLLLAAPTLAVLAATLLPFNAIALVDMWVDRSLV